MAETKASQKVAESRERMRDATADEFGDDRAAFLETWDFKDRPEFIGTILTSRIVHNVQGLGGVSRDVPIFTVVDDNGEKWSMWGSGMLERVLPEHIGHRVKIADKGLEPQDDGTSLRVYDVRCATCTAAERS